MDPFIEHPGTLISACNLVRERHAWRKMDPYIRAGYNTAAACNTYLHIVSEAGVSHGWPTHYSDITWALCCLKSPVTGLFLWNKHQCSTLLTLYEGNPWSAQRASNAGSVITSSWIRLLYKSKVPWKLQYNWHNLRFLLNILLNMILKMLTVNSFFLMYSQEIYTFFKYHHTTCPLVVTYQQVFGIIKYNWCLKKSWYAIITWYNTNSAMLLFKTGP